MKKLKIKQPIKYNGKDGYIKKLKGSLVVIKMDNGEIITCHKYMIQTL